MAAVGYSGAEIDPEKIAIWFGELPICANGGRAPEYDEEAAHAYLEQREYSIRIALGVGEGQLPILDERSDGGVCADQRGVLDVRAAFSVQRTAFSKNKKRTRSV